MSIELGAFIKSIRDRHGITVLLVEHHMGLVMSISDQVVVLNFGRKITEGKPAQVQQHPEVIKPIWERPPDDRYIARG